MVSPSIRPRSRISALHASTLPTGSSQRRQSAALAVVRALVLASGAAAWGSAGVGCGGGGSNACADACVAAQRACQERARTDCPRGSVCLCEGGEACLKRCF